MERMMIVVLVLAAMLCAGDRRMRIVEAPKSYTSRLTQPPPQEPPRRYTVCAIAGAENCWVTPFR
jgi:hypothetical protein